MDWEELLLVEKELVLNRLAAGLGLAGKTAPGVLLF